MLATKAEQEYTRLMQDFIIANVYMFQPSVLGMSEGLQGAPMNEYARSFKSSTGVGRVDFTGVCVDRILTVARNHAPLGKDARHRRWVQSWKVAQRRFVRWRLL